LLKFSKSLIRFSLIFYQKSKSFCTKQIFRAIDRHGKIAMRVFRSHMHL